MVPQRAHPHARRRCSWARQTCSTFHSVRSLRVVPACGPQVPRVHALKKINAERISRQSSNKARCFDDLEPGDQS